MPSQVEVEAWHLDISVLHECSVLLLVSLLQHGFPRAACVEQVLAIPHIPPPQQVWEAMICHVDAVECEKSNVQHGTASFVLVSSHHLHRVTSTQNCLSKYLVDAYAFHLLLVVLVEITVGDCLCKLQHPVAHILTPSYCLQATKEERCQSTVLLEIYRALIHLLQEVVPNFAFSVHR